MPDLGGSADNWAVLRPLSPFFIFHSSFCISLAAPLERKFRWKAGMGKNHDIPSQQKPKWIALDPIPEFLMRLQASNSILTIAVSARTP
jgi:hypothetical protein